MGPAARLPCLLPARATPKELLMVQLLPSQAHHKGLDTRSAAKVSELDLSCNIPSARYMQGTRHSACRKARKRRSTLSCTILYSAQAAETRRGQEPFRVQSPARLPNSNSRDCPLRSAGAHRWRPLRRRTSEGVAPVRRRPVPANSDRTKKLSAIWKV